MQFRCIMNFFPEVVECDASTIIKPLNLFSNENKRMYSAFVDNFNFRVKQ